MSALPCIFSMDVGTRRSPGYAEIVQVAIVIYLDDVLFLNRLGVHSLLQVCLGQI